MSIAVAEPHSWLMELQRLVRHIAADVFAKYPIPAVQDQDDIINEVNLRLLEYVGRRDGRRPKREHLENKIRYLCFDIRRKNHRLGFTVRRGDQAAMVVSMDDPDDREFD